MTKKIILLSVFFLFFGLAPHVFAQGFVPLAPIEGLTKGVTANTEGLANFFNNLYKFAIGMASVLAIIMIIWGGLQYATQDVPGAKNEGKERIQQAILGLILVLSPVLVFSIINPSILNLSINLPKLDTKSGGGTGGTGGTGTQAPTVAPATGCVMARSGLYLETIVCASRNDATSYTCQNVLKNLTIPSCQSQNPNTNVCEDKNVRVYCWGKTLLTIHYSNRYFFGLIGGTSSTVIPRDAQAESTFISGCTADGGVALAPGLLADVPCPTDGGIPNFSASNQSGISCHQAILSCKPPN